MDSIEDADLEKLATDNVEEYLDRLRERDPRFTYEVTFGGERGPSVFPPPHEPHLVSSMTDGRKIIKAYARDHEALRQDPVGSLFQFNETGEQKFLDFIRTGKEQIWAPEEIRAFRSTVPLLSQMRLVPGSLAMSVRSMPDDRIIPLKLMFSKGDSQATLDYGSFANAIRCRRSRDHHGEPQPLGITLVLPLNPASEVKATISTNLPGENIREVAKACGALKLLQAGCTFALTSPN